MSSVLIDYDIVEAAVQEVYACDGESPTTTELFMLLRYAAQNEQPISVCARDLEVLESYL